MAKLFNVLYYNFRVTGYSSANAAEHALAEFIRRYNVEDDHVPNGFQFKMKEIDAHGKQIGPLHKYIVSKEMCNLADILDVLGCDKKNTKLNSGYNVSEVYALAKL